ncbi:Tetratricopeptide TPR_2 repeat protein [Pirellula staleyi DSM 6068]|uniref:Tetratricopeptide TPR_2 repeat protein n=1 Tax=Pirellula staleyi (strain ATCC 27377 / DSM 6068 / ICPB 4128) TaxID=530564 RepID=D2R696_PIRSD|nr:tetratricopeptide repeat protein [Pirellula staleyi]ADB15474.1 Tetratricopeptide TPR_2 repeat protein [Pirellula staleyi DSM 6068]
MDHGRPTSRPGGTPFLAKVLASCLMGGLTLGTVSLASAQKPAGPKPATADSALSPAQRLRAAYALSSSAKTYDDFAQIIEHCERALGTATGDTEKYAKQLVSWAYNKRGELYAQEAETLVADGEERKANELDNLALDDFETAIAHDPERFQAIHNRAVSYVLFGKLDQALTDLDQVIKLAPKHPSAHFNRAEVQRKLGKLEAALADYTVAIDTKTGDVEALARRGEVQMLLDRYREALGDFNQALRFAPQHQRTLTLRGELHTRLGNWEQASLDYAAAVKLLPGDTRALRGAAWLLATCPADTIRSSELALASAKKAADLESAVGKPSVATLDTLAAALAATGDFEAAVAAQQDAITAATGADIAVLKQRLSLYKEGQPYRMPTPAVSSEESGSDVPVTTPPKPQPDLTTDAADGLQR